MALYACSCLTRSSLRPGQTVLYSAGVRIDTVSIAEQYLPRNICPLVKSSFGSIVNNGCSGVKSCSHFGLVDMVVAENTCDSKKKTYELLGDYVPTYVLDLPQRPDSPAAVKYFLEELNKFKGVMEQLTGNKVTVEQLKKEIVSSNETRKLLHRLYDLAKNGLSANQRFRRDKGHAKAVCLIGRRFLKISPSNSHRRSGAGQG